MGDEQNYLLCAECGEATDAGHFARWRVERTDEPGERLELVVYCPDCARREFGDLASLT